MFFRVILGIIVPRFIENISNSPHYVRATLRGLIFAVQPIREILAFRGDLFSRMTHFQILRGDLFSRTRQNLTIFEM